MKTYDDQLFDDIVPNRRKPETSQARAAKQSYRIAKKYPQAVMKVISFAHDAKSVMDTLSYISREGDLELEDPMGFKLDAEETKERLEEWAQDFDTWKKVSRESMHLTLSSPAGSDPDAVLEATRLFAREVFPNHDYLLVRHDDTDHPHCHVVVKTRGWDLSKLNPGRKDLRDWREEYAHCLRDQGVNVEASSRLKRGLFGRSTPGRGVKYDLQGSERGAEVDYDPIPLHKLSDPLRRALVRSEAYQQEFVDMGKELVEKGEKLDNKGLTGMGEAINRYADTREQTQLQDVQRLHFARRRINKAVKAHKDSGLDV